MKVRPCMSTMTALIEALRNVLLLREQNLLSFLDLIVCMHEKGNWRKWTLNSSQGHNGHCFLPSAAKTKWLQMASASTDHLLNMNVFFTLRTHTHWKAMTVYSYSMCRCTTVKLEMWMQALVWFVGRMNWLICHFTVFHILCGLISVLSEAPLMWPWGPFGSLLSC